MASNGTQNGNGHSTPPVSAATKLRRRLQDEDILVAPGVYDGFGARIAHEVGFDCIYMVKQDRPGYTAGTWKIRANQA